MLGTNIGIDLGTTSIVVFVEGKGIVMTEPCVAAYEKESGKLIGVGKRAWDMIGKNPDSIRRKARYQPEIYPVKGSLRRYPGNGRPCRT